MSKMQACYEKQTNGNWQLVVHHDGIYNSPLNKIVRSSTFNVPDEIIEIDGSPNLGKIKQAFPAPQKDNNVSQ